MNTSFFAPILLSNQALFIRSILSKTVLGLCFVLFSGITPLKADCNLVNISSNTNPLAGCTGIVTITGTFTVNSNYNLSTSGITELRISGVTATLFINGNFTLTLPATAKLSLVLGATITNSGCNANVKIVIGTRTAQCTGGGGGTFLFSEVQASGGFTQSGLPVELAYFKGEMQNKAVQLNWQTSAELNNDKFIIETSSEGEVFNRIGEIAGAGTSTETHNYQFTHHTPSAGVNYYRLKQVDFDGTFAYSKVLAIDAPGSQDVFAFPNPAKDKITLQYDYSKGRGNIQLFDALGRRVNTTIAGYAGNYEVKLPEGLPKGTYWLKVERGGKVQTVPVVKE